MKKFINFICLFAVLFLAASCQLGLGAAIDVEVPVISISSPESGAVIRDKFGIFGTWSDDGSIKSVTANFKAISYGSAVVSEYEATVEKDSVDTGKNNSTGTWSIVVDPFAEDNILLDGTYEVSFVIEDNGGHKTTISRQFIIDNTAPLIVLQRPSTDGAVSLAGADSYGQSFTLEGQGADDNNIDHIDVKIYSDADRLNLVHTVTLNNVPPTIELDVAKYGEDDYTTIYGSTEKEGAKQFYCSIEAFDSAQRYPVDGSNQSASDTKGNSTTTYYLYDQISSSILANFKITDVYHMLSGVYSSTSERSSEDVISAVKTVLSNKSLKVGSFSLNPTNNPTFVVNGKDTLKASGLNLETDDTYAITNNSDVILEVSPGLDNTPLVNNSELKVYVVECNKNGTALAGAKKYYPTEKSRSKSGSNYKLTVTVGNSCGLTVGKNYLFGMEGKDEQENTIIAANNGYGFYLAPSGNAPELKVENPSASMIYVKKDGTLRISGYTIVETGAPTIKILRGDDSDTWKTIEFTENQKDHSYNGDKNKYNFDVSFDKVFLSNKANKKSGSSEAASTDFSITIQSSQGGNSVSVYKTVMYDVDGPVFSINNDNISPAIESYIGAEGADSEGKRSDGLCYSNGKVSVTGSLSDEFSSVSEYTWFVTQGAGAINGYGNTVPKSSKVDISFDTTGAGLSDKKITTVVIKALDTAGNETIKNISFFLDQSTDKPVFEAQDGVSWKVGIKNPNYIQEHSAEDDLLRTNILSGDLYSKLCDDDGVAVVKFNLRSIEKVDAEAGDDENTSRYNYKTIDSVKDDPSYNRTYAKSGTEASVAQKMPPKPGFYEITQTLYDKNYDSNKGENDPSNANYIRKEVYVVKVQGTGPQYTLSRASDYVKTSINQDNTYSSLTVNVKIDQGEEPYRVERRVTKKNGTPATTTIYASKADDTPFNDTFTAEDIDFTKPVTYIISDANGTTEKDLSYTVDNTAPDAPSITSPVNAKDIIDGVSYVFSGKANDKTNVNGEGSSGVAKLYYAFQTSVGVPATWIEQNASNGTWNINKDLGDGTDKLSEGEYYLYVKVKDAAGNESAPIYKQFFVDQNAPVVGDVKLNDSITLEENKIKYFNTKTGDYEISLSPSDTYGIDTVTVNGNAATEDSNTNVWTYIISRTGNDNKDIEVRVDVTDNAGRVVTKKYQINNDTIAPQLSITAPDPATEIKGENSLNGTSFTFRANSDDTGSAVKELRYLFTDTEISNTDADIIASAKSGSWTSQTSSNLNINRTLGAGKDLAEGEHFLYVYVIDNAGNESVAKKAFTVDINKPVVNFALDVTSSLTNAASVKVSGKASDSYALESLTLSITGKEDVDILSQASNFSQTYNTQLNNAASYDLADGKYTFKVVAVDKADKNTEWIKELTIDTNPPQGSFAVITEANTEGWYNRNNIDVKFTPTAGVTDLSGIAKVEVKAFDGTASRNESDYDDGTTTLYLQKDGTYQGTVSGLTGTKDLGLIVKDNAGNCTYKSKAVNIDTTAPQISEVYLGDDTENELSEGIIFYYEDSTATTAKISGKVVETESGCKKITVNGEAVTPDNGEWSKTLTVTKNTSITIPVYIEDNAGNKVTRNYKIYNDTVAPAGSVNWPTAVDSSFAKDGKSYSLYKTGSIKVVVESVTDAGSGVESVTAKYDGDTEATPLSYRSAKKSYEGSIETEKQGVQKVIVTLTDAVGNATSGTSFEKEVFIDSIAPDTCTVYESDGKTPVSAEKLINGSTALKFYVSVADYDGEGADTSIANSGIKSVTYKYGTSGTISGVLQSDASDTDHYGKYLIDVPANTGDVIYQPNSAAKIDIEDNAGNIWKATPFTFKLDNISPTITMADIIDADDSSADKKDVNGILTVNGTSSDGNAIEEVVLKYYVGASAPTNDQWSNNIVSTEGDVKTATVTGTTNWTADIDTTNLTDNTNLYLKAWAYDTANNVGTVSIKKVDGEDTEIPAEQTLYINQDSDRPVIIFSNLDLATSPYSIKNAPYGTVRDDDEIASFEYKIGAGEWQPVNYSSGSWDIPLTDGTYALSFKINDGNKDYETNGTNKLKLRSKKGDAVTTIDSTAAINLMIDNAPPESRTLLYRNGSVTNDESDSARVIFGGTYNTLTIKIDAKDYNGITSVKAQFEGDYDEFKETVEETKVRKYVNGTIAKNAGETTEAQAKASAEFHTWTVENIPIPKTVTKGASSVLFNDNQVLEIIITDGAGLTQSVKQTLKIDNEAPEVKFTSHKDGSSVFATDSVTVIGNVTSNDLKEWYYTVTNSATNPGKASISNSLTPAGQEPGTSFKLIFDKRTGRDASADVYAGYNLFERIIKLENDLNPEDSGYAAAKTALEADDDVRDLYLWVYAKDEAGNESEPQSINLKVIPNGDKPSITISYPSSETTGSEITLGGIIRVTGGTEIQNRNVEAVYVQIDPQPTVTWPAATSETGKYYKVGTSYKSDDKKRYTPSTTITAETVDTSASSTDVNKDVVFTEDSTAAATYLKDGDIYRLVEKLSFYNKNVAFTESWESHLDAMVAAKQGIGKKTSDIYTTYTDNTGITKDSNKYLKAIRAGGTTASWNLTINSKYEFDTTSNSTDYVAIRVFAKSSTGKMSDPVVIWYNNDKNSPQIGSSERLQLEKADGSKKIYEPDMWIKGNWILKGSVEDDSGIKQIDLIDSDGTSKELVKDGAIQAAYSTYIVEGEQKTNGKNYKVQIPVGSTAENDFGTLNYEIIAYEAGGTGLSTRQTISLKFDNKAPELKYLSADKTEYTTAGTATTPVDMTLSSGTFKLQGTVTENTKTEIASGGTKVVSQSGFSRVAVFFTRTRDSKTNLIDPMLTNLGSTDNGYENFIEVGTTASATVPKLNSEDHLYWYEFAGASISNNVITVTQAIPEHVRNGGLAKINGVYYPISSTNGKPVNYTDKTVAIKGNISDAASVNVYFAVAQIIEHATTEGSEAKSKTSKFEFETEGGKKTDKALASDVHDDGDQMIETAITSGVVTEWSAGLDTSLIMDGNVTINIVAFDEADNVASMSYTGNVKNNAPRIYGVKYATDRNGNGKIDDNEWINKYSQKYSVLGYDDDDNKVAELEIKEKLTVKGLTTVIPQIVAGNKGIGYTVGYKADKTATTETSVKTITEVSDEHSTELRDEFNIALGTGDFLAQSGLTGDKYMSYKLWDYTDDLTAGSTSYFAQILLPVKMSIKDTEAPDAVFTPFHWESASNNSLYNNSTANGHIELEADWTAVDTNDNKLTGWDGKTDGSTVLDSDPKVSGIITLDCTASDNVIVQRLVAKLPGLLNSDTEIAKRDADGNWTSSNNITDTSSDVVATWGFQLVNDSYDEDTGRNTVTFKLHFNTAAISTVADANVGLEIKAYDRGEASKVSTAVKYSAAKADTNGYIWFTDSACTTLVTSSTTDDTNVYRVEYTAKNSTPGNVQTTAASKKGYYRVDIVPYVTEILTSLKEYNRSNPSVYTRTAKGKYSVREDEKIIINGFNLTNATVTLNGTPLTKTADSNTVNQVEVDIGKTATSGNLNVTVNSVEILNNSNNNFAKGSYTNTVLNQSSSYEIKQNYGYNLKPNNLNNNNLTDDVVLDVWQTKIVAEPYSGPADYVTMKINPVDGTPGFSFANSILYFNMPGYMSDITTEGSQGAGLNGKALDPRSKGNFSQTEMGMNYGGFTSNTFAYDKFGMPYGIANCIDTDHDKASAFIQFFSRQAPMYPEYMNQGLNYAGAYNGSRLDMTTIQLDAAGSKWATNINRLQSPSMITSSVSNGTAPTDTAPTYIYIAYYDDITKQVRFRWGTVGAQANSIDGQNQGDLQRQNGAPKTNDNKRTNRPINAYGLDDIMGGYWDTRTTQNKYVAGEYFGVHTARVETKFNNYFRPDTATDSYLVYSLGKKRNGNAISDANLGNGYGNKSGLPIQIVAASGGTDFRTEYAATPAKAGKYVSLAIIGKDTTIDPTAVVAWYDQSSQKLYAAYNDNCTTTNNWVTRTIDTGAGQNVKIIADGDGGIHFAYYKANGSDLKYAYVKDITKDPETDEDGKVHVVTVDSYSNAGAKCTIDIAKVGDNWVPYIGYQYNANLGTPAAAKVAYKTDFSSFDNAGSDDAEYYTGKWEISIIPTESTPGDDSINVGVRRDGNGNLTSFGGSWSLTGDIDNTTSSSYANGTLRACNSTKVTANNTSNPLLGYVIDTGSIEMAQKK